jgi:hypothetical protein
VFAAEVVLVRAPVSLFGFKFDTSQIFVGYQGDIPKNIWDIGSSGETLSTCVRNQHLDTCIQSSGHAVPGYVLQVILQYYKSVYPLERIGIKEQMNRASDRKSSMFYLVTSCSSSWNFSDREYRGCMVESSITSKQMLRETEESGLCSEEYLQVHRVRNWRP